jgi:hypothetical protein
MTKAEYKVALLVRLFKCQVLSLGKLIRSVPTPKYATISLPYTSANIRTTTTVCNTTFILRMQRIACLVGNVSNAVV